MGKNDNISEKENIPLKEEDMLEKNLNSFQKLKSEISSCHQEIVDLRKEIEKLKDNNNRLRTKNLDLINMIKTYKSKETQLFFTEENLKNMKDEYNSLKDSILKDRENFRLELRLKDNIYNQDIIQTNLRTESLKHQVENFNGIKKLNDILYIKNNELKKNLEDMKYEEKTKLEELEIKYNKKLNNYKRKMIDFLKRNEKERDKNGTQTELNNKLNILHIQELVNEIEIQGVEVEDLLKERQELKFKILQLNRDLDILSVNKFKKNSYHLLTESDKKQLNINLIRLKKKKYRGCTHNEKLLKIIKEKYLVKKVQKKLLATDSKNNKIEVQNLREKNDYKENNNDDSNNKNLNQDKIIEFLFKEREKYKDSAQFYKDKLDIINNKFSFIMKIFNEALEKIYKEELNKNNENIVLNINDFKKFDFEKMKPEQKYAILIKLINHIAPFIYKEDLENNLFIKSATHPKEKYRLNSFNASSQNSTRTPSKITGIVNLKSINNIRHDMKNRKSIGCFNDYKKVLKKDKNKTLYRFSNSKISIDLLPKVDLLDL